MTDNYYIHSFLKREYQNTSNFLIQQSNAGKKIVEDCKGIRKRKYLLKKRAITKSFSLEKLVADNPNAEEAEEVKHAIILGFSLEGYYLICYNIKNSDPYYANFTDILEINREFLLFTILKFTKRSGKLFLKKKLSLNLFGTTLSIDQTPLILPSHFYEGTKTHEERIKVLQSVIDYSKTNFLKAKLFINYDLHVSITQSIDKNLFYAHMNSQYSANSKKKINLISVFPSPLKFKDFVTFGITLEYITNINSSNTFSPVKNVLNYAKEKYILCISTSSSVEFIEISLTLEENESTKTEKLNTSKGKDPFLKKKAFQLQQYSLQEGLINIRLNRALFGKVDQSNNNIISFKVLQKKSINIERFVCEQLTSQIFPNYSIKDILIDYQIEIIKKNHFSNNEIYLIVVIDYKKVITSKTQTKTKIFRSSYFGCINLDTEKFYVLEKKLFSGQNDIKKAVQFLSLMYNKQYSEDLNSKSIHRSMTNNSMFKGKSLDYLIHPDRLFILDAPKSKEK